MIKKCFWKILLVTLTFVNCLSAKPEIVDLRVIPGETFDVPKVYDMDMHLFIDNNNVLIGVGNSLWLNNRRMNTDEYGFFLNGFLDGNKLYLVFEKEFGEKPKFGIYSVGKDIILENNIAVDIEEFNWSIGPSAGKVISVPGDNIYYLFGYKTERPSGVTYDDGHGIHYNKPVLSEIRGQKVLKPEKIPYGGKTDESYQVKEILTGKDTIHLFGLRTLEQFGSQNYQGLPPEPEIVHYAEYNTRNKKLVRSQDIYEDTPRVVKSETDVIDYWYGNTSADKRNEKIVFIFSWVGLNCGGTTTIKNVKSDIYYSQCDSGKFSEPEYIGDGLEPLVRIDSLGNVHVVWIDKDSMLVHRAKKGDKWEKQQVIPLGEDMHLLKTYRNSMMCAEFDKDNNLRMVFISNGQLVYAKIRVN